MGYRDELGAVKARNEDLEGEVRRLEKIKAPERAAIESSKRYARRVAYAAVAIVIIVGEITWQAAGWRGEQSQRTVKMLRDQISMLRGDTEQLQKRRTVLLDDISRRSEEARRSQTELDRLAAQITAAQHDRSTAVAPPESGLPLQARRLTRLQIAERLALCKAYPESPGRYPYAEGVVTGIEEVLDLSGRNGWGGVVLEVHQIVHLTVPGRDEVVVDPYGFPRDENRDTQLTDALFWNRVEVGDILGISWNAQDSGTKSQILRIRTTGK